MNAIAIPHPNALPTNQLTVFNAGERFYMARKQLEHIGGRLEELTTKDDPGVLDLCVQFSMLRTMANKVAHRFEVFKEEQKNSSKNEI